MGKWKIRGCPRCGGSLFVNNDMDGWYEQCINCSYINELKASLGKQIDGASGRDIKGFSNAFTRNKLDILNQFGSDESLVQEKIDSLTGIVGAKKGKRKAPKKGLEGILPGLIKQ